MEQYILPATIRDAPHFEDDQVIAVTAVCASDGRAVPLPLPKPGEPLRWDKPEGTWTVWIIGLSRNCGPHRDYINMLDPASCKLLLDAVYEPHWARYQADFGKTIAGFFSDEPELGNGHIFTDENQLGTAQDLPFASTLPPLLAQGLGADWANRLYLLWDNGTDASETARVRYAYMDAVTKLVRESFSRQIGDWCRAHGVQYIGHVIEDNNSHARVATSLGHYFRGLDGQDMSGIDDIGGQVLPQGEDEPTMGTMGKVRNGEFYHYMLGNLAASAAAIEPGKQGRAMCEIFGNYGWAEGVRLEKYLADHFLVRGINYFVPHAFSPAPFPDPDCPPHFYAHGHNPQYRHFGALMGYMNRVATLTSGGARVAPAAILYHGEAEWTGRAMLSQKPTPWPRHRSSTTASPATCSPNQSITKRCWAIPCGSTPRATGRWWCLTPSLSPRPLPGRRRSCGGLACPCCSSTACRRTSAMGTTACWPRWRTARCSAWRSWCRS